MGDMDFKMAGTAKGITAIQADLKIPGLPLKVLMETITQGFTAKAHILRVRWRAKLHDRRSSLFTRNVNFSHFCPFQIMSEAISKPRDVHKDNWPIMEKFEIPAHKRSQFVGIGGRNLKRITADTGVTLIPAEESCFEIFAPNQVRVNCIYDLMSIINQKSLSLIMTSSSFRLPSQKRKN